MSSSGAGDDMDLPIPRILIVLSNKGIDPTSVAKPWKAFVDQGYIVEFATEFGQVARAEQRFLERSWFRQAMGRTKWDIELFYQMVGTDEYLSPHAWGRPGFSFAAYDAVIFPGIFNKTVTQYTESKTLQSIVLSYFPLTKRVVTNPPKTRTFDIVFKRRSTGSEEDGLPEEVVKMHQDGLRNYEGPRKVIGAIGRGVLVLSNTKCELGEWHGRKQINRLSGSQSSDSRRNSEVKDSTPSASAPPAEELVAEQAESSPDGQAMQPTESSETVVHKIVRRRSSNLLNTKRLSLKGLSKKGIRRSNTSAGEMRNKDKEPTPRSIPRSLTTIDEKKKKSMSSSDSEPSKPRPSLSRRSFSTRRRVLPDGPVSILYNIETTAVPTWMESVGTTLALAYGIRGMYKNCGSKKTTQAEVTKELESPYMFYAGPKTLSPFTHVDPSHHYVSARYPGDAELFAAKLIEEIQLARKEWGKQSAKPQHPYASSSSPPSIN